MASWMKRVFPVVTLAASVAIAAPEANETSSAPASVVSDQVRPADPVPEEIRHLHKQVDQLQRTLELLREQTERVPQYLDQGNGPITGP
jgi:excinuclease UvrABC helicase subunit UvrB